MGQQNYLIEGTGLGLSISKHLIEMMDGQLYVESILGQGSLFWFEIKLSEVQAISKPPRSNSPTIIGYRRRIDKTQTNAGILSSPKFPCCQRGEGSYFFVNGGDFSVKYPFG